MFLAAALPLAPAAGAGAANEPQPPRRIVSLAPSYDETLIELGLADRIVGVTSASDYLPELRGAERVGIWIKPNVEKIVALRPDLVLAADFPGQQTAADKLTAIGIKVMTMEDRQNIEEIFARTRALGDMLGEPGKAKALLERMQAVIDATRRKTLSLRRARVYVETGSEPLFTCGRGSFIHELIEIGGGSNIAAEIGQAFPRVSSEFVLSRDPEVIILPYMGRSSGREALLRRKGWDQIAAVRNNRVYDDLDSQLITIPSPRLILNGLPELAQRIHPELNGALGPTQPAQQNAGEHGR